ncbi:MAG: CHASE domain-containing protein [Chthonomonadales bacterium]|nr:CHASE domain-containing protein [Chthonomonadales bacterium]
MTDRLPRAPGRRHWIPWFVLAAALTMTLAAGAYVSEATDGRDRVRFASAVRQTQDWIRARLETYIALLRGGVGLFSASGTVDARQFYAWAGALNLPDDYPGVQGVGYSTRIPRGTESALVARMRAQGFAGFRLWPEEPRAEQHAILYLDPLDARNRHALGYDMYSDRVRRVAMARARDTGQPAASGKVQLVQEITTRKLPGFLVYVPVYASARVPGTVAERRAQLRGFVYSPFRAPVFLDRLFGTERQPPVDYRVYSGSRADSVALLYDSNPAPHRARVPRLRAVERLDVAGTPWTLEYAARPEFELSSGHGLVPLTYGGGLFFSLALFAAAIAQSRARSRAERIADHLRRSEATVREDARTLELVRRSGARLAAELDRRRLVEVLTQEAGRLVGAERGAYVPAPGNDGARLVSACIFAGETGATADERDPALPGALEAELATEGVVRVSDTAADARFGPQGAGRLRSYLAVRIVSRAGEPLGGLWFGHRAAGWFAGRHQHALAALAAQAAVALDNATLYEEAQREIAERRQAEAALRAGEERLNAIVTAAPDGIITLDAAARIESLNTAAEALFGYAEEELAGRHVRAIVAEAPVNGGVAAIDGSKAADGPLAWVAAPGAEAVGLRRDGQTFPVAISCSEMRVEDRRLFACIVRDITEPRRHAAHVEALNERLQRAMMETHHRVKNNLQTIAAMVEMSLLDGKSEVPVADLRRIASQVLSLAVVHDILTERARAEGSAHGLSARRMLAKLLAILEQTSARSIGQEVEDVELSTRQGTSLAIVVNELVTNAVKHGSASVMVRLALAGPDVVLTVSDDGPGFPDGFDPARDGHTGLELVERLSRWDLAGAARYETAPGGGARVSVRFPHAPPGAAARET